MGLATAVAMDAAGEAARGRFRDGKGVGMWGEELAARVALAVALAVARAVEPAVAPAASLAWEQVPGPGRIASTSWNRS